MTQTDNDALVRKTWAEISCAADTPTGKDDEDAFLVGLRDGFEDAVQLIDLLTGGDGEYRFCSGHDPDRHCPSPVEMIDRILAALRSPAPVVDGDKDRLFDPATWPEATRPQPAQDEVEVVARALAQADGWTWDRLASENVITTPRMLGKGHWITLATAAIASLRQHSGDSALREAGLADLLTRAIGDITALLVMQDKEAKIQDWTAPYVAALGGGVEA